MKVSDFNSTTIKDREGIITGICDICKRDNVRLSHYRFNEPKQIVDWNSSMPVKDNPNALQIAICGTDMNLISRIKKESSGLSSKQILDRAKEYRAVNPIRDQ